MDYLVHHMLERSARSYGDKEAFVCGETRLTYRQAQVDVTALARGLQEAGIGRGERVGVILEPSIELPLSILGISKAGGVFVPVNAALFPHQVAHIVRDCGMKALIVSAQALPALGQVIREGNSLDFVVVVGEGLFSLDKPLYTLEQMLSTSAGAWRETCVSRDLAAL